MDKPVEPEEEHIKLLLGGPRTYKEREDREKVVNDLLHAVPGAIGKVENHTAAEMCNMLRHQAVVPGMQDGLPESTEEKAPQDINVYTDGSFLFGTVRWASLGGAAAWWPGRDLAHQPLTEGEDDLATECEQKQR